MTPHTPTLQEAVLADERPRCDDTRQEAVLATKRKPEPGTTDAKTIDARTIESLQQMRREDAEVYLRKADTRSLVHDANIAGQRDFGSAAQRDTV